MTRASLLLLIAIGAGCSGTPPAAQPAVVVAPPAAPEPSSSAPLPEASRETRTPNRSLRVRVEAALPIDGEIDSRALVVSVNTQLDSLVDCAALIRRSGSPLESVHVELSVERDGTVTAEITTPLEPEAQRCLLAGLRAWRIPQPNAGRVLLLLTLTEDGARP